MQQQYLAQIAEVKSGEWAVFIEYCTNCVDHNSFLWHNEQRYKEKALEIRQLLDDEFGVLKVFLLPLETARSRPNWRLGLFEVVVYSSELIEPQLIYSKLKTRKWPENRVIINKIRMFFQEKQLRVNLLTPPNCEFHPLNPFRESMQVYLVAVCDLGQLRDKLESEAGLKQEPKKKPISDASQLNESHNRSRLTSVQNRLKAQTRERQTSNTYNSFNYNPNCAKIDKKPLQRWTRVKINRGASKEMNQTCTSSINKRLSNIKANEVQNASTFKEFRLTTKPLLIRPKDTFEQSRLGSQVHELEDATFIENKAEIEALLNAPPVIVKAVMNGGTEVCFGGIKPGNYKIVVLEDNNFEQQLHHVKINLQLRTQNFPLEMSVKLRPKNIGFLTLVVQTVPGNPIYRLNFQQKFFTQKGVPQQINMTLLSNVTENGKNLLTYEAKNLDTGYHVLSVEYKNFEMVNEELHVHPGVNHLTVKFPELLCQYFETENANSANKMGIATSNASIRKNLRIELQSPLLKLEPTKDEKTVRNSESAVTKRARSGRSPNFTKHNAKEPTTPIDDKSVHNSKSKLASNKENKMINNQITESTKNQLKSALINRFFVSNPKSSRNVLLNAKTSDSEKHNFHMIRKPDESTKITILIDKNSAFEVKFEFLIKRTTDNNRIAARDFCQHKWAGPTKHQYTLSYVPAFEFGRIYVERKEGLQISPVEFTIIRSGSATVLDLAKVFETSCNPDELFCDIVLITSNTLNTGFECVVCVVPMRERIECFTGIGEIQMVLSFAQQSRFDLGKLFGFKDDSKQGTLPMAEVMTALLSYKIELQSEYLLNAVRATKNGDVSVEKLREMLDLWQTIGESLAEVEIDEEYED